MAGAWRITVLCENIANREGLVAEHGIALLIEGPAGRVLLDAGPSDAILANARTLGVSLRGLDAICLSHGHADHTGGLEAVLRESGSTPVFAHPRVFERRFSLSGGAAREIGPPRPRAVYEDLGARFHLSEASQTVVEGLLTTGETRLLPERPKSPHLLVERDGGAIEDDFRDDLSLCLRTSQGVVVLTGCAHRGIPAILEAARAVTGDRRIRAVAGGLHLSGETDASVERVAGTLRDADVGSVFAGHCTGLHATAVLASLLGARVRELHAGDVIEFEP